MKNLLVGFSVAVLIALAIFFFYIVPEKERIKKEISEAYHKGYEDCFDNIDTVFTPAEPKIVYREKTVYIEKPTNIESKSDSIIYAATSIDTTLTSGLDEIKIQATVGLEIDKNKIVDPFYDPISSWFLNLEHKDFECVADTIKLKVPKYIDVVKTENNWLYVAIAFLTGNLMMLLAFIL